MSMYSMESQLAGDIQRAVRKPLEELCASLVSGEGLEQARERFLEKLSEAIGRSIANGIEEIHGSLH
jgi:hypothetical protein